MNIVQRIHDETLAFRDRTALVEGEARITYAMLLARIDELAQMLASAGISPAQRIAFFASDGIDYVVGALAILKIAAAVVPVADSLTATEIHETVERIAVHGMLIHRKLRQRVDSFSSTTEIDASFIWQPLKPAARELDAHCMSLRPAFIRFSSGTTGQSKGVALTHQSIIERTDAANRGLGVTDRDVILWVLGMSHHFVVSILLFLRKGATIIVANGTFPFSLLDAAVRHPVTLIYASPVHYFLLASSSSVAPEALGHVRLAISTAMKMPREVSRQFAEKFKIIPAEAYGIIEIGLPFIDTEPHAGEENSVGKILPDYELRLANQDSNGIGEVWLRGKGMFDAYVSPWQQREDILVDGWFHTGDLGRLDSLGRLTLLGRSKAVIVCAGMKVFPEEVEETINSYPGVKESLVSGRAHLQYGQTIVAQITLKESVDPEAVVPSALRAYCIEKLSSYKVPVEFQIVDQLPKTPSGKLLRRSDVSSG